jgi:hypothetical protein
MQERLDHRQDAFIPDTSPHPAHQSRVVDLIERSLVLLPALRTCRRRCG